jgi:hypothetical protein
MVAVYYAPVQVDLTVGQSNTRKGTFATGVAPSRAGTYSRKGELSYQLRFGLFANVPHTPSNVCFWGDCVAKLVLHR